MAGIVIRREVTDEDYEGVVSIRTAYGGRDYLPVMYHTILKRHKGFVATLEDKMVGYFPESLKVAFRFIYMVDNGMTIIPRAGRVHQDYEGLGIYKKLDEYTMQFYRDARYKAVSFHNRSEKLMRKVDDGTYRITFNRKLKTYRTSMKHLKSEIPNRMVHHDVKHLGCDDLGQLFSNTNVTKHLFSEDIFVSCWMPLRIIPQNAPHVLADHGVVFATCLDKPEKAMISIGHPVQSSIGLSYVMDIYGLQDDYVADHIMKHLQTVLDYKEEVLQLEIFSDDSDIPFICKLILDFGFEQYDQIINEMHCIEQKLGK